MGIDFGAVLAQRSYLLQGLALTAAVSVISICLSFGIGIGLALCRVAPLRALRSFAAFYIDVFRNTPFLVQLFFLYYGLPEIGIATNPVVTGTLALSLSCAAGNAEIIRSGIETVDVGIVQAAQSFGLSTFNVYRLVIIPIALRTALRPLGSAFVNLVLTTSVLSTITVNDFMGNAITIAADTFRPFEVYLVVLVVYCVMTFTVSGGVNGAHALMYSHLSERPHLRG
jgi:His/Glu/Gln/Arg/opine family amino acid ABC transporter permease subunit